jgi:hypothetical protein
MLEAERGPNGRFIRSGTAPAKPPSRRFMRNYPKRLTGIDKRGRLYLRIVELTKLFEAELGPELTPMQRLRLEQAAQLMAIAEEARGRWMRKEGENLHDIVRCERAALLALRELGLAVTGATHQSDAGLGDYLEPED